jgi:D-alanine transaminase
MLRIAYLNGAYVPYEQACVHIEDRGFQFADAVYEVCEISDGCIIDITRHLNRLDRSLGELRIDAPMVRGALTVVMCEVVRRNRVRNGLVYLQVTRGIAPRDHVFPPPGTRPGLFMTAKHANPKVLAMKAETGVKVISVKENRWDRVDIKSTSLLPNVLARQSAKEAGAQEAWFVDRDGFVTEGGATNAWIITAEGKLVTRPAEHGILRGVTRTTALDAAQKLGLDVEERAFTVEEAKQAREAFITSATSVVIPVVEIDGSPVANGHPGSISRDLRKAFFDCTEKLDVY